MRNSIDDRSMTREIPPTAAKFCNQIRFLLRHEPVRPERCSDPQMESTIGTSNERSTKYSFPMSLLREANFV